MKTHSDIKAYECNLCDSAFTQESYLKKHMVTHNGERNFKCSQYDT